ncbi:MAG: hypothetical protein EPN91_04880 [Salinibacterium sp.]|nr:MAG: hypothetical protein EPN91_04880 [Salinibacterium sp.]
MKYAPVLTRALVFGATVTAAILVIGSAIGYAVAGVPGLLSALVGAGATAVLMGFTTMSMLVANRAIKSKPSSRRYYAIIMGVWFLKFLLFMTILLLVRDQEWMNAYVFFFAMVAAVVGSLIADIVAFQGARVPYVGAS